MGNLRKIRKSKPIKRKSEDILRQYYPSFVSKKAFDDFNEIMSKQTEK